MKNQTLSESRQFLTLPKKWLVGSIRIRKLNLQIHYIKIYFIGILKSSVIFQNKYENSTFTLVFAIA